MKTKNKKRLNKFAPPVILLLILGIQINGFLLPKSEFEKAKIGIVKHPDNLEAHLDLTEELIKNNRFKATEYEAEIIFSLQQNNLFQDKQSAQFKKLILVKQENNPPDLKNLIQKWQKILQERPNYRDGWLKLAVYLTKLKMNNEALKALNNAKKLDPNYKITKEVEAFLLVN